MVENESRIYALIVIVEYMVFRSSTFSFFQLKLFIILYVSYLLYPF